MKRHSTDAVSLTFGLIFVGAVAVWLVNVLVDAKLPAVGWFVAVGLIIAGTIGLLTALRSDPSKPTSGAPVDPVSAEPLPDLDELVGKYEADAARQPYQADEVK